MVWLEGPSVAAMLGAVDHPRQQQIALDGPRRSTKHGDDTLLAKEPVC